METATLAFGDSGIPIRPDHRLRECDYGELNGCRAAELEAVRLDHLDEPFPGGQSYRDVVGNTRSFLADLHRLHDGQRVLVIAHSANRWALQHLLDGIPLADVVAARFQWQPGWTWTVP